MLSDYLAINVFQFMLVFARLGVVFIMLPGISASYVPARMRLVVALLITVLVLPIVKPLLPPQPQNPADLLWLITSEALIGGFLGAMIQTIMATLELAGQIISTTTGITNALTDDPVTEEQSSIIIGLINLIAIALIFITGAHEFMIMAIVDSYNLLLPNANLFAQDMLSMAAHMIDQAFYMGVRLAAPFLVFEMVFQVTSGIMARLSPQLNVFFVVMPGKILLGFAILMITLPTLMLLFMRFFDNNIHGLLNPVTPIR